MPRLAIGKEDGARGLGRFVQDEDTAEMDVLGVEVARVSESSAYEERVVLTVVVRLEQPHCRGERVFAQWQPSAGDYQRIRNVAWQLAQLASDPDYAQNARNVLEYWIAVENRNLARMMVNLRGWQMPDNYETNVLPRRGRVSQWLGRPSQELLDNSVRGLSEHLELLARQLHDTGHCITAVEAALLFWHLSKEFPGAFSSHVPPGGLLTPIASLLNNVLGENKYVFEGLDELQRRLESIVLKSPSAVTTSPPTE